MRAFLCHSSNDSAFVVEVARHLKRSLDEVFYYEDYQKTDESFVPQMNERIRTSDIIIIFVGLKFSSFQEDEAEMAYRQSKGQNKKHFFICLLPGMNEIPSALQMLGGFPRIDVEMANGAGALALAREIIKKMKLPWRSGDGLPLNPHLFSYEKDIIKHFIDKIHLGDKRYVMPGVSEKITELELEGCPSRWPKVVHWIEDGKDAKKKNQIKDVGEWRPDSNGVLVAALTSYHESSSESAGISAACLNKEGLCFPEAGPREYLFFPREPRELKVAILVSGGIAPGINAVIDGIAQRHDLYAEAHGYHVEILALENGFYAFKDLARFSKELTARESLGKTRTDEHANEAGSIITTARVEDLINGADREEELRGIVEQLFRWRVNILYVIGGDGSMKAAHAIWNIAQEYAKNDEDLARKLSVVAIPKTMDNDILWVWQSFGFLSAVERAREFIGHIATEVKSNPRLGIVQLFGSDSGFVVSHAVLASSTGTCDLALIPEVEFSLREIAGYIKRRCSKDNRLVPHGLIVMAETAIPTDAMRYVDKERADFVDIKIELSDDEKKALQAFEKLRHEKKRIQGQTNDYLRSAGLKIVKQGLEKLLPDDSIEPGLFPKAYWDRLRVFANEPRHLLRSMPPSCLDIINGNRLGALAVDNALAGHTDFMISQWLTEYVLVPLELVVLGRKRIWQSGIFWRTVLAKTGQPAKLA
jgi:6-phosphofructokinase 1